MNRGPAIIETYSRNIGFFGIAKILSFIVLVAATLLIIYRPLPVGIKHIRLRNEYSRLRIVHAIQPANIDVVICGRGSVGFALRTVGDVARRRGDGYR